MSTATSATHAALEPTPYEIPKNDHTHKPFTGPVRKVRARAKSVGQYGRYCAGIKWSGEWQDANLHQEQIDLLKADELFEIDLGDKPAVRPLNDFQPEDVVPALAFEKAAKAKAAAVEAELEAATAPPAPPPAPKPAPPAAQADSAAKPAKK